MYGIGGLNVSTCFLWVYPLVRTNSSPWKIHQFLRTVNPGKPSINRPLSMAMENKQRVYIYSFIMFITSLTSFHSS